MKSLFTTICAMIVAAAGITAAAGGDQSASPKRCALWYNAPAPNSGSVNIVKSRGFPYDEDWEHWSLPIGNGYMGLSIFGRTDTERMQLTEKTLGNKGPYNRGGLTSFAEFYLDFDHRTPANYRRELSLDSALHTVTYDYEGVRYKREYYANYPSNVIVVKLTASQPGKVSFLLRPVIPYLRPFGDHKDGRTGKVTADNSGLITLSGQSQFFDEAYEGQIKVIPEGGTMTAFNDPASDHGMIRLDNADSAVLLIAAGTSYKLCEELFLNEPQKKLTGNEHPHAAVSARIAKAVAKGEPALRKEHLDDYIPLFSRVQFKLTDKMTNIPTDRLLDDYKNGKRRPYLEEVLFQYGRYLLIATSRKGSLPPNLQGVWSQYDYSPWSGGYWHNINIQMNYWPVFNTNLAELFEPYVEYNNAYLRMANRQAVSYLKKNNPEALDPVDEENGWTIGTGANAFAIVGPGGHSGPGTGAFTTKLFWDYYDFTRDKNILRDKAYPVILGMAKFLSKTLKDDGEGHLLASPSASPEQRHNGEYYHTVGCTFDQSMIYENHNDLLKAADILKIKDPFIKTVRSQIGRLDAIHIGESGQIKEYREERAYSEFGDPKHRHISHLCALYPGTLINGTTPEWMQASIKTLNLRGDKSTGWAMAHRLNLWARTKDGNRAFKLYQQLLTTGILENLWDTHPPFQIDGNFGATSGVAEMLLQSHEGYIEAIPALPDAWKNGSYKGLVARGNFVCDVDWKNKAVTNMHILSRAGGPCVLKCPSSASITSNGRNVKTKTTAEGLLAFDTKPGQAFDIKF